MTDNYRLRIKQAIFRMPYGGSIPAVDVDRPPTELLAQLAGYLEALQIRLEKVADRDHKQSEELGEYKEQLRALAMLFKAVQRYFEQ